MRILAVNNDPHFQETLVQMQLNAPRDVISMAETPVDALEAVKATKTADFDCFVIQNKMAKRDQASLIPALRALKQGAHVPILILADTLTETEKLTENDPARLTGSVVFPLPVMDLQDRISEICAPKVVPKPIAEVVNFDSPLPLSAQLEVFDTPGIVSIQTLETYISQLPRRTVYGSSCIGFAIRDIELHHESLSAFDFHSLINDVADVISDEFQSRTALFAYAGDGVFVGIIEDSLNPQTQRIMRQMNTNLQSAMLVDSDETPLDIRLSAGQPATFTWRSASAAESVMAEARANAIIAREEQGKLRDQFWFMDRSA